MIRLLLCLAAVFLSFTSHAFAIDEQRVEDAVRHMAGASFGWDLVKKECVYNPQRPEDVIAARVVFHWGGPKYREVIVNFQTRQIEGDIMFTP